MSAPQKQSRQRWLQVFGSGAIVLAALFFPLVANAIIFDPDPPCADCDGDGSATVGELQHCHDLATGSGSPVSCPSCDVDGDGRVTQADIDLLIPVVSPFPTCPPVIIDIGSPLGGSDGKAMVPVTLSSGRFTVGGTQNDILFNNDVVSLPSTARCHINPAIGSSNPECLNDPNEVTAPCKDLVMSLDTCGGDPQPDGCPEGAGSNIKRLRALVTSFQFQLFNAIPNGVLYECEFDIIDSDSLPAPLANNDVVASRPRGEVILDVIGTGGFIEGSDLPPTATETGPTATATPQPPSATPTLSRTPTQSPTPTTTPTGTLPPTPVGFQIVIGSAGANAEGEAVIPVSLIAGTTVVAGGMQNDIVFDNTIVALSSANRCRLNPELDILEECLGDPEEVTLPCKTMNRRIVRCGTNPQPDGCPPSAGDNLSRFRAIIASTAVPTTNPLPPGLLYTCTFQVLDAERLPAALIAGKPVVSSPFGMKLFPVEAISGAVTDATPLPTFTHSATPPPSSTATPTASPSSTSTSTPSSTPTLTPPATASSTPSHTLTPTPPHSPTPTATTVPCDGDCDGSNSVTVDEITRLVNLALGNGEISECTAGDLDGSETITVDELLTAVTRGLNGCPDGLNPSV